MADDRIVIKEPRLDLGTNRVLRHGMSGEDAFVYLDIHHPKQNAAAVRDGNPAKVDRTAGFVEGELEAIRARGDKNGIPLVQKDLILETPGGSRNVMVPNPVAGYVEFRNDGTNAISIWSAKPGDPNRELLGQVLHGAKDSSPYKEGQFVPYGAPLVRQSDVGSEGAVHAHIELEPAQYKRYLGDILNDRITRSHWPEQGNAQSPQPGGPAPATASRPRAAMADGVLEQGERGGSVRELQERLNQLGVRDAQGNPLEADGRFGRHTREAVEAFQRSKGLNDDGEVGRDTFKALKEAQPQREPNAPVQPAPNGPPPFLPERTQGPLISDQSHPNNALYRQALDGLGKLGPGGYLSERDRGNAAASMAYEARVSGLARIDHVVPNASGTGYFAVEGGLNDPTQQRVYMDKAQGAAQSVEQSTQQLRQDVPAVQPAQQEPQEQPARSASHHH